MKHNSHTFEDFNSISIEFSDKKYSSMVNGNKIFISKNGLLLPSSRNDTLKANLKVGQFFCLECNEEIGDIFTLFDNRVLRTVAKISFWTFLGTKYLTSNTRMGASILLVRSLLTLFFYTGFLVFSNVTSPEKTIVLVASNFALWILFENGVLRSSLSLNKFKRLAHEISSTGFLVSAGICLTTILDFLLFLSVIGIYSLTLGNIGIIQTFLLLLHFCLAYIFILPPMLLFSFAIAHFNRNFRDLKHFLPWFLRLLLFTIPIFQTDILTKFKFFSFLFEFSPLGIPFMCLSLKRASNSYSTSSLICYLACCVLLFTIVKKRSKP